MTINFTAEEILQRIDPDKVHILNRWLARGDGVAVYQNKDFSSARFGDFQFVSFGSEAAQITGPIPQKMPDLGGQINWQYQLEGIYRGASLAEPPAIDHYKVTVASVGKEKTLLTVQVPHVRKFEDEATRLEVFRTLVKQEFATRKKLPKKLLLIAQSIRPGALRQDGPDIVNL